MLQVEESDKLILGRKEYLLNKKHNFNHKTKTNMRHFRFKSIYRINSQIMIIYIIYKSFTDFLRFYL